MSFDEFYYQIAGLKEINVPAGRWFTCNFPGETTVVAWQFTMTTFLKFTKKLWGIFFTIYPLGLEIKTSVWQLLSFNEFYLANCALKANQCSRQKMIYLRFSWWNHWSSLAIHYDHISKVCQKIMRFWFYHLFYWKMIQ